MQPPRLLILADERLLGRGLATLLEARFETHLVESFERACRLAGNGRREVVLWVGNRIDASIAAQLKEVRQTHPGVLLCLIANCADPEALRDLLTGSSEPVAALRRNDGLDIEAVLATLDDVLSGRSALDPRVLTQLLDAGVDEGALANLTQCEQQILELIADGLRNGEIARRLWKSEKAIEKQVGSVFAKLGLDRSRHAHLDRRVTAARIYYQSRPQKAGAGMPARVTAQSPARAAREATA